MTKELKIEALNNFKSIFPGATSEELASKIGINKRTMERLLSGDTETPNKKTADQMREIYDQAIRFAQMNKEELSEYAEKERYQREQLQRKVKLSMMDGTIPTETPLWFRHAASMVEKGSHHDARDLMLSYLESESEWNLVQDDVKPHVLAYLAMTCHYTGRVNETIKHIDSALSVTSNNYELRKVLHSNKACAFLRKGDSDEAFNNIELALNIDPSFIHPLIIIFGICEQTRNKEILAQWIGRAYECIKRDFSKSEIDIYLSLLDSDPDIGRWTRSNDLYKKFLDDIKNISPSPTDIIH